MRGERKKARRSVRRQRPIVKPKYSADHYRNLRHDLVKIGTIKKNHSPSTQNNLNEISERWVRYAKNTDAKPMSLLQHASREDVILFLRWNLDNYSSRKRSSIRQKFKHWRQFYRKHSGSAWPGELRVQVNDYINGTLTEEYKLNTMIKEKPVMNIDDVFLVLHHHWSRDCATFPDGRQLIQLALLILLCAYTASRPGALVYVKRNAIVSSRCALEEDSVEPLSDESGNDDGSGDEDEKEQATDNVEGKHNTDGTVPTLCYKHVTLVLLPSPHSPRDVLAMEIDLRFTKGYKRNPKRKIFCLYEVDHLIFDPTLFMITMALQDNAFELEFESVSQIFHLRVNSNRRSMQLKWKDCWKDKPVFRQAVPTPNGVQTSVSEPLRYHTFLYYIQRLGFMAGMMKILNPYNIRRGSGEAVDTVASQALLQQVMGHRDAGTLQAYLNERVQCDVQAAFLGRPSADALFKAVTHMSRDIDPRAPIQLKDTEFNELKTHPLLIELRERRDSLSREAKMMHSTIKNAKANGSTIFALYKQAESDLRNAKKRLQKEKLLETRAEFFDKIETEDARRQLGMVALDLTEDDWQPQMEPCSERKRAVQLLCEDSSNFDTHQKLTYRIQTIETLFDLCHTQQAPPRRLLSRDWGVRRTSMAGPSPVLAQKREPITITDRQCIFCVCKGGRQKIFCRPWKAKVHVEKQHLAWFKINDLIPCPDEFCRSSGAIYFGHEHFKNHIASVHKASLLPYTMQ